MTDRRNVDPRTLELSDVDFVMSHRAGRNFMARLLEYTGIDTSAFNADGREHARNEGRREAGIWVRNELKEAAPDKFMLMLKEQNDG